ncbi:MAG: hypothetical protein U0R26_09270 [Solirubrobacterales bacterium]
MRGRLAIPLLLTLAILAAAAAASAELSQSGNLRISFDASFAPRSLPRDHPAPVTVSVEGSIATTDGTHPPALRRLEIALNRNGTLSTWGLPACTAPLLQSTTTQRALERCRPALVGRGSFAAKVASERSPVPASGRILVFNGEFDGKPALLLHLYGTVPVRVTFVLALTISHHPEAQFGTILSAPIPSSPAALDRSPTSASRSVATTPTVAATSASSVPAAPLPGAVFSFARGSFYFADSRQLQITLTRDCHVR